ERGGQEGQGGAGGGEGGGARGVTGHAPTLGRRGPRAIARNPPVACPPRDEYRRGTPRSGGAVSVVPPPFPKRAARRPPTRRPCPCPRPRSSGAARRSGRRAGTCSAPTCAS